MRRPHFLDYGLLDTLVNLILTSSLSQLRAIWRGSSIMNTECRVQLCERRALLSILGEKIIIGIFRVSRSCRAK